MRRFTAWDFARLLAGVLALSWCTLGQASEPKLRGGKGVLKLGGESGRYHLVEPGAAVSFTLRGPGTVTFKARAVQPGGAGFLGTLHVSVDGAEVTTVNVTSGTGHFVGRRDLNAGPTTERDEKIADGQHVVVLNADSGPVAVAVDWQSDAANLLMATPLIADKNSLTATPLTPAPPSTAGPSTPEAAREQPPLKTTPSTSPELVVPLTVDSGPPHRAVWPYAVLGGALVTGLAGAVVWGIAAGTDGSYNSAAESPGRNGKLSTANGELHAAEVLAGVAIGIAAIGTVGLIIE